MDINAITKDSEIGFHNQLLAMKSKHSPWFERTTANLFITSINVTSKYQLPVPRDYLMFTRASLLYDTMCARLDPKFDFYKEYKRFSKAAQKKARKRGRRELNERLRTGLTGSDYQAMGQVIKTGSDLLFRAQRLLNVPYDFAVVPYTIEKWTFTAMMVIRFAIRAVILMVLAMLIVAGISRFNQQPITLDATFTQAITAPVFIAVLVILLLQHIRLIMFRLGDKTRKE
jgi:predicted unusual protein kinase regulating ubiquinone biosynthesis (AarF/ABC1/UbiB family)